MSSAAVRYPLLADVATSNRDVRPAAGLWSVQSAVLLSWGVVSTIVCIWLESARPVSSLRVVGVIFATVSIIALVAGATYATRSRSLVRNGLLISGSVVLTALSARLEIPLQPVPVTGQTFAVLLVAAALGWRRGYITMVLYLLAGTAGLPMFAITGSAASLGYLAGFTLAALVVGWLAERGWDRTVAKSIVAMLAGEAAIYLCGLVWLAQFTGWSLVAQYGLYPFIVGDALKLVAAALLLPAAWVIAGKVSKDGGRP